MSTAINKASRLRKLQNWLECTDAGFKCMTDNW